MIVTDNKIEVTTHMMRQANMQRGPFEFGVPVDPNNPVLGVRWKWIGDLTEADFDAIESYFLQKQNA